jgi:hypothetical protein
LLLKVIRRPEGNGKEEKMFCSTKIETFIGQRGEDSFKPKVNDETRTT